MEARYKERKGQRRDGGRFSVYKNVDVLHKNFKIYKNRNERMKERKKEKLLK